MIDLNNQELRLYFPEKNIYISRNHNFAFAAWEIARLKGLIKKKASLIHIDNHLDYCDPKFTIDKVDSEEMAVDVAKKLRIDEFIIPAQVRKTIGKCFTISNDSVNEPSSDIFERAYTWNHYEHNLRRKWFDESENTSCILDLDLDFFNSNFDDCNSNPILLSDQIVRNHLENIKGYTWEWDLITVALSPEYCGGNEACLHLFNLFLEVFELDINQTKTW